MLLTALALTGVAAAASASAPAKRRFVPDLPPPITKRDGSTEATPAQTFDLRIDTGTGITYVYDGDCGSAQCAGRTRFAAASSSSYQVANNNTASVESVGGGVTGVWGVDKLEVGGTAVSNALFLRASDAADVNADSNASGVLGLARAPGSLLESLAAKWGDKRFGVYLAPVGPDTWLSWLRKPDDAVESAAGGGLTLGGVDGAKFSGEVGYAPASGDSGWTIELSAVSANMAQVELGGATSAVVDTGSSGVYGPNALVERLYAGVEGVRRLDVGLRADVALYAFPCGSELAVSFWIAGREFPMLADSAVANVVSVGSETLCTGSIVGLLNANDTTAWTLGSMFLRNVYTVFRLDPPAVGFADLADDLRPPRTALASTMLPLVASLTGNASVTDALSTVQAPTAAATKASNASLRWSRDAVAIALVLATWATILVFAPSVSPLLVVN
ncbi:hypothetical protein Q8F55_005491 [Vanrija albida]|uniref:Peptidase A1 domain-containing protein n=1 Tax=Vanrija albida TaxID=181172 RepID=A0ABR3Q2T1_9TREE